MQSFLVQLDLLPYGILFLQITCGTDGECTLTEVFCVFKDANSGPHLMWPLCKFGWEIYSLVLKANTWFLVRGVVWRGLSGGTLLEEVESLEVDLEGKILVPHPVSPLCVLLKDEVVSFSLPLLLPCLLLPARLPCWDKLIPLELEIKFNFFFHKLLLVMVFYPSTEK